jgi:hypothetical protein
MRSWELTWRWATAGMAVLLLSCGDGPSDPGEPLEPIATSEELLTMVSALAHDSVRGRRAASPEDVKATEYVASLVDAYGLDAASGATFFREVPGRWRSIAESSVSVDAIGLTLWTDFVPTLPRTSNPTLVWDAQAIYGGNFVSPTQALPPGVDVIGRAVVMDATATGFLTVSLAPDNPLARAAVVFLVNEPVSNEVLAIAQGRRLLAGAAFRSTSSAPLVLTVSRSVAEQIMGQSLVGMQPGHTGARVRGDIGVTIEPAPMRNVVAVLPGTDAALSDEYVVIGAHLDHLGVRQGIHPTDSIFNGADDNASGSAALLMVARHYAEPARRPRRSLMFIWFAAEELGLIGSEAFTHAPAIPLASVSAFINLDMLSRGRGADIDGGGPDYLQSIGSRRRSTALAMIVDSVAARHGMHLDFTFDAAGHPERVFCRSDQWNFARFGVPVVFFTTGLHPQYHTIDDEVELSDFEKLARVTTLVSGVVDAIASRPGMLTRDLAAPDPDAVCEQ